MARRDSTSKIGIALVVVLVVLLIVHLLFSGSISYGFGQVFSALLSGPGESQEQLVVWGLRLPRGCMAALIGANLAVVGAVFQALFRNPLADPYIVGVSSGAAVGGVIALLLGFSESLGGFGGVLAAFATAVAGMMLVIAIGKSAGLLNLSTLLLAGVAVGSFLWALITFLLVSSGADAGRVLFWLLGSLVGMDWARVALLGIVTVGGTIALWIFARPLTLLSTGEEVAISLGVAVEKLKWIVLLVGSAMAAAAVAAVGIVGFVGLFTPNIARRMVGSEMKRVIPTSMVLGAIGVLVADILAQRLLPGREVNIGVITALFGAPFLIVILRKRTA